MNYNKIAEQIAINIGYRCKNKDIIIEILNCHHFNKPIDNLNLLLSEEFNYEYITEGKIKNFINRFKSSEWDLLNIKKIFKLHSS